MMPSQKGIMMRFTELVATLRRPVVIGMLHVPALPGAPGFGGDLGAVRERVLADAGKFGAAGVDAMMLENFGDIPFFPGRVGHETAAYLTMLACAVKAAHQRVLLGINVLRNDGVTAMGVAHAAGAAFIRVNVLSGARVTDQGVLQGIAHDVLRLRRSLGATGAGGVEILADVDVKNSAPLGAARGIEIEVDDLVHRGLADGLIVSGSATGKVTDPQKVAAVKATAGGVPVFVGSGVALENVGTLKGADGFIVGTSLKESGSGPAGPVDEAKARRFVEAVKQLARGT
jgi:membrane complex biogenesis BtpA family protein